jgi:hypothetical protein
MLGGIQDVCLGDVRGVHRRDESSPSGGCWAGLVRTRRRFGGQSVALAVSSAIAVQTACSSAMVVFSVQAASSEVTGSRLMGAAGAAVDDADGVVGENRVPVRPTWARCARMYPSASAAVGSATHPPSPQPRRRPPGQPRPVADRHHPDELPSLADIVDLAEMEEALAISQATAAHMPAWSEHILRLSLGQAGSVHVSRCPHCRCKDAGPRSAPAPARSPPIARPANRRPRPPRTTPPPGAATPHPAGPHLCRLDPGLLGQQVRAAARQLPQLGHRRRLDLR